MKKKDLKQVRKLIAKGYSKEDAEKEYLKNKFVKKNDKSNFIIDIFVVYIPIIFVVILVILFPLPAIALILLLFLYRYYEK